MGSTGHAYKILVGKHEQKRRQGINGKIILEWTFGK
jgi:hypothetical protein